MAAKALVVLAHPGKQSLSRLFAGFAAEVASSRGFEVEFIDLHGTGFNPVLNETERGLYYGEGGGSSDTQYHARMLSEAELVVLCFPTWWFGLPAILKGWIDRVFAPGVAFDHADNFGPIKARLQNLRHVVAITTLGSPWWVDWLVLQRPVRRILKRAVFGLCAPKANFRFLSLYRAESVQIERLNAFRQRIEAALPENAQK